MSGITPDLEQEPYEGKLHVRICAEASGDGSPYLGSDTEFDGLNASYLSSSAS